MTHWWCHVWGMPYSSNTTADLHLSQWPTDGHKAGASLILHVELMTSIYPNDLLMVTRLWHTWFLIQNCWPPFIPMTYWWSQRWGMPDSSCRTADLHLSQWPTDGHKAVASLIPHTELLTSIYRNDLLKVTKLWHTWFLIVIQICWPPFITMTYWRSLSCGIPDSSYRTADLHLSQWPTDGHKVGHTGFLI